MGARGPLPQPSNVRALRGNPGKRQPAPSLKAKPGLPSPPGDMPLEARAEWRRMTRELDELGVVSKMDRAVLATYCEVWARSRELSAELNGGLVVEGTKGDRKSPAWQMYRESVTMLAALAKELLATPAMRARTPMPEAVDAGDGILD